MIKRLPVEVYAKIAAGEVIHRPFSVVKELVENSVDAKATYVEVEIKDGGKKYISVTDNGRGMTRDDLNICFEKHSTSKIERVDDLEKIYTLGFRGEALHSIAAVSKVEISSKTEELPYGTKMRVEDLAIKKSSSIPMNRGTKVEVKNLFYNLPVRKKFMKSSAGEARVISETVIRFILCYPEIKFKFISNNKEIFVSPGNGDFLDTIGVVYGNDFVKNMVILENEAGEIKISGYTSNLDLSKKNSKFQYVFLNGRFIKNSFISYAVHEAYKDYYREKKYPVFFLNIKMDAAKFDVNIHPSKEEVRFENERELFSFIKNSISLCLRESINAKSFDVRQTEPVYKADSSDFNKIHDSVKQGEFNFKVKKTIPANIKKNISEKYVPEFINNINEDKESLNVEKRFSEYRIMGQMLGSYIVVEGPKSLMIIDQHVAHERVLYEKYLKKMNIEKIAMQRIMFPVNIELKPYEADILEKRLGMFEKLGFGIEKFGESMFVVREVPVFIGDMEDKMIREIVDDVFTSSYVKKIEQLREDIIINASCKKAIKAGKPLSNEEMNILIHELFKTENPYICPHGRPVILEYDFNSINSKFQRVL